MALKGDSLVIRCKRVAWAVSLIAVPLASDAIAAPPFNCSIAKEQAEIAVCDSADLGLLDREMSQLYYDKRDALRAAGKLAEVDQFRSVQLEFLKRRNDCGYDTACITAAYKERLKALGE